MQLDEAKKILKKAGFICEIAVPTPMNSEDDGPVIFNDLSSLQQACSDAAITKHEYAQYDEFEQEPWCYTQEIREIPMEEFGQAVGADKYVGRELTSDEWENLVYDWFSWLCENDFMGWDYT